MDRPNDVLARGDHLGFEWIVVHNGMGYRCGYVRLPHGHPWHGRGDLEEIVECHGGVTFAEPDRPCDKGGEDDAFWVGFDCAHAGDLPDRSLPGYERRRSELFARIQCIGFEYKVRDQEYVEGQCRLICEQACQMIENLLPT